MLLFRFTHMRFGYYDSLSLRNRAIYDKSDRLPEVVLPVDAELRYAVAGVRKALDAEELHAVQHAMTRLSRLVCSALEVAPLEVRVKAKRPIRRDGEYHGLYEREAKSRATLTLWMRTARQKRVVTFKTFLRTFVHELCHHLDFDKYGLKESFHTQGFFKRESGLYKKLAPEDEAPRRNQKKTAGSAKPARPRPRAQRASKQNPQARPRTKKRVKPEQTELPFDGSRG